MSGLLNSVLGTLMQDGVTEQISNKLGLEKNQAQSALASAVPILMKALSKNASTPEGANALENALKRDHDDSVLDNLSGYLENPKTDEGSKIINHILGKKRTPVEQYVSKSSGLSTSSVDSLLSSVAPLIMGALAGKNKSSSSNIGSILSGVTNEIERADSGKEQSIIEQLLDRDNDGSIIDDVTDMGMSFLGKVLKK